jgi:hypothetical protein
MFHPERMAHISPGLRVRELPWVPQAKDTPTLKGLKIIRAGALTATPSGLGVLNMDRLPRVGSRTRQPWADLLHPFGMEDSDFKRIRAPRD